MKKFNFYQYTLALIGALFLIQSCQKYETEPLNVTPSALVFDSRDVTGVLARQVVNNIYSSLPNGFNRIDAVPLDAATDDAVPSAFNNASEVLSQGRLTAENNVDDRWATSYNAIRRINDFLAKENQIPNTQLAAEKKFWRAEVRFIRALHYFELLKRYGGVPLIGNKVFTEKEAINVPRNSFDECVDYIVSECNGIKDSLKVEPLSSADWGRIPRGAAMALKAKALLYAASPLNNTSNTAAKWQAAAQAARDLMALNYYKLEATFPNAFLTRTSLETILAFQRAQTSDLEQFNSPIGYNIAPISAQGYVSPSQELVDLFPTRTGLSIQNPASGYNPNTPYANRDPRLDATVFYNGMMWLNRSIETFEGGKDKPGGISRQTRTGYYMKKFLGNFATATAYSTQTHNFPIFRYADILLMYAEAINEAANAATNQTEALTQLRALRMRAGITAGTGNLYGIPNGLTQTQLREVIRNERRIEMAFEEQRFWDIRRWKIAENMNNKAINGVKITKTGTTLTYTPVTAARLSFTAPKHYVYPIPFSEVNASPAIKQNTGY
jgi:starch-binding outer membrane protein, SusD/RagB family